MLSQLFALLPLLALVSAGPIVKRRGNVLIESGRNPGQCLSIQGGRIRNEANPLGNGTPVVTLACDVASLWDISKGSGSVLVTGSNYALDIGLEPTNNGGLKAWVSYPGATQQTWYLTDDNRIAQTGGKQCIDQGDNGPQTYECTTGNTNQVWNVRFGDSGTIPNLPTPTPGFLNEIAVGPEIKDIAGQGKRLRLAGRQDLCVWVAAGAVIASEVVIKTCSDSEASDQVWDLPNGTGQVKLHGTDLCLDAGENPSNGIGAKVWTCGDYPQQQWTMDGNQLKTANNQCLDVTKESGYAVKPKPYGTYRLKAMQTWECSTNQDPYMAFAIQA